MKKQIVFILLFSIPLLQYGQMKRIRVETADIGLSGSETARIKVSFIAGTMDVSPGGTDILSGEFRYTDPEWKPLIGEERTGGRCDVLLRMPEQDNEFSISDPDRNEWDIELSRQIPMDLALFMGAGKGDFDLKDTRLERLYMKLGAGSYEVDLTGTNLKKLLLKAGVGEIIMDLSGSWDNDMVANMTCGIGEITLYLPEETGVIVKTSGILGGITARDFKRNNKVYTNRQYGKTEHTLFLNIEGGIGHINLRQR